ncbi:hypothetical protein XA68_12668 [Ophiocordyceps unilateralis]|uniref:GDP/GTP exchange factor Sec2 N-terminal domain-containing protein n=1 Tax=Ophiocordyceps unilateralis TaxID=268505 RepID=A0A2A9PCS3_OPHUN|nr:hypothetical protein XA68_12668 [Ophiocordyceps unilateralis]
MPSHATRLPPAGRPVSVNAVPGRLVTTMASSFRRLAPPLLPQPTSTLPRPKSAPEPLKASAELFSVAQTGATASISLTHPPFFSALHTMESLIHVAGWSQHQHQHQQSSRPCSARPFGHLRSLSSVAAPASEPTPSPSKTESAVSTSFTPPLPDIPLRTSHSVPVLNDEMSTLPDPRSRTAMSPGYHAIDAHQHPDLDDELATLSAKLVNAINYQTLLDDTLTATRQELLSARQHIRSLEDQLQSQRDMMAGDVWVRRSSLDAERKAMLAEKKAWQAKLADEKARRLETDSDKRKMEQELENLTTALFEEANNMVIAAKEEAQAQNEALARKNDQLRTQLADSESLLKSQQEQLSQLKDVMESMASERDDLTNGTAPSSPGVCRLETAEDDALPADSHGALSGPDGLSPCNPTSFHHLLQPVLRTDLASYEDFIALARLSDNGRGSRASSGSLGGLTALALGLGGSTSSAHPSNGSTTSLSASAPSPNSSPQSPNTPPSAASGASSANSGGSSNLKDTRFYKRVLADDIEPTLRLDAAPGLSWLARRSVLASVTDGSLIVEPVPNSATYMAIVKPHHHPCSLCGESRKDQDHLRNHRFRTSEANSAQRYPLCSFCLGRVRSTCDFLGFLRLLRDGHWRADGEDQEKAAWEESVKLREQMFWARIGGGVVPASHATAHWDRSSRPSQDVTPDAKAPMVGGDGAADEDDYVDAASQQSHPDEEPVSPRTPPDQMLHRSNGSKHH